MAAVTASSVYYIKLGRGGDWEAESIRDGVIRFGYREAPHELCTEGDWEGVREAMKLIRGDAGAATRDVKQIRAFYESGETAIFSRSRCFAGRSATSAQPITCCEG
jgi:hypothetical protein